LVIHLLKVLHPAVPGQAALALILLIHVPVHPGTEVGVNSHLPHGIQTVSLLSKIEILFIALN